mmetsp:Transcript_20043/g.39722  ORF Transcript_20043/g.39722 Transcript_20043/m.39722 type:complete len:270 (-) Transcript_20043:1019-1828(-)
MVGRVAAFWTVTAAKSRPDSVHVPSAVFICSGVTVISRKLRSRPPTNGTRDTLLPTNCASFLNSPSTTGSIQHCVNSAASPTTFSTVCHVEGIPQQAARPIWAENLFIISTTGSRNFIASNSGCTSCLISASVGILSTTTHRVRVHALAALATAPEVQLFLASWSTAAGHCCCACCTWLTAFLVFTIDASKLPRTRLIAPSIISSFRNAIVCLITVSCGPRSASIFRKILVRTLRPTSITFATAPTAGKLFANSSTGVIALPAASTAPI